MREQALLNSLNIFNTKLANQKDLIDSLNPLTILSKGYSVTKIDDDIVKSVSQINIGDVVELDYADGKAYAEVTKKELNE